ncbi:NACHT domain-containing protein [Parachlamydia sp. AcF125]|uniref:NACHT domain-containing protein n=1 Tax=Parachlamydia sp. AcF125 TaxID=2795736 RepID=UPI001BCA1441|nr:NACHT domain-containing protein [Parachlamydia sp. AcF125]MBS4168597.1 TAL effector protein PthXo1 [Parachlamydia sp. AcF125]
MDINASFLLKADRVSDYIPAISTITNLIDLFQKCVMLSFKQKASISKSHYYTYLKQKNFSRCIVLLLPVIGNILVAIYDFAKSRPKHADVSLVVSQPVPLSAPKSSESGSSPKPTMGGIATDINRELGEHAESSVLGTSEARAKGGIHKKHSQALVAAGYPAETALKLVSAKKTKKEVSSLVEQLSLGMPDCYENSIATDQTKLALNTPRASAKNIYLEQNAQLHVHSHAHSIIQCKAEPSLSQEELVPQNLVSSLRNYYLSQKNISILRIRTQQEWELKVPLEEIYVRLGIIENKERKTRDQALDKHSNYIQDERAPTYETIFEPKQEIELEKLFEHESLQKENSKKIYLQGSAGSGKSTLCHYISYRWAKGELWQDIFACLFWIPLRNLTLRKYPEDKDYTSADLIAREYKGKIDRRVIDFYLKDPAFLEKTLLVLDGYDELSADVQGNSSLATAFKELKELFPHILITSRPGSCSFKRSCDLELLGFDKKGVDRYIDKFFTQVKAEEKKEKLRSLLKSSPQVLSLARIPMLLILLCCLFHEDPKFFKSNHSITMTAIYERMINRMYQGFLLRRIGQSPSSPTQEHILTEENLRQNLEVDKIATIFEEMAYFAMEKDTLYLSKQEIGRFIKDNKALPNELTDCGLLRIPEAEEKGYFIHLTFQEFLTASKVANQYLEGERQTCQAFVQNYKFEPRYALLFRMIAGSLSLATSSNRRYANVLQHFFDDLFAAPQDFAVSGELTLIAECFEECQNPSVVKQYDGFIRLVKDYIKHLFLLNLDFERLLRNRNFLNHPEILPTIGELLSDPRTREKMLIILLSISKTGISLASEIVGLIVEQLKDPKKYSNARRYAVFVLEQIAKQGSKLPQEALAVLYQAFDEDTMVKNSAARALEAIAKRRGELSEEAFASLIQALQESEEWTKNYAARALGSIAKQRSELSKEVLDALMQALKEGDSWNKGYVANALVAVVKQGGKLPGEALDALIQALKEGDRENKGYVADALVEIVKQGGKLPGEALDALIQALKEGDRENKGYVADALVEIVKQGGKLPGEALDALIQVFKEGDEETKCDAAGILRVIAIQGGELSKEALAVLIQALKKGDKVAKRVAADDLTEIAIQGGELSKEALAALILALQVDHINVKIFAAGALRAIAEQGGKLPKEGLAALILALQVDSVKVKISAAGALRAIAEQGGKLPKEALDTLIQALKEGDIKTKYPAAVALLAVARQGGKLPKEALDTFIQALKEGDEGTKYSAAVVLVAVARQGGEFSKEALDALIEALKEGGSEAKDCVVEVLGEKTNQGGELSKELLVALALLIKAPKEDESETQYWAVVALGEIIKQGGKLPKEALAAFIQALKEAHSSNKAYVVANILGKIAKQRGELSKEALEALSQTLTEGDFMLKSYAAVALVEIAEQREELPKEVLDALIQALKEGDEQTKHFAADALVAVARQGGELSKKALDTLIQALKEGDTRTKFFARLILKVVARQGGELSKKAVDALIQACKEDDGETKYPATDALIVVARQGGELSKKAVDALIQARKEDDGETKYPAAGVLRVIARQGGEFSKEALAALLQALKEGDNLAKFYAVTALKKVNKNALLKMGGKAFALIAEVCFFIDYSFSVKGQQLQVSDKRVTYLSELTLELSYKEMREQLPPELSVWRKRLDSLSSSEIS